MRKSDYCLNATEICAAAGGPKPRRSVKVFSGDLGSVRLSAALGFRSKKACLFLRELKLLNAMKSLLSHAPIDMQQRQYKFLECGGILIAYIPSHRIISVTHLLKLGNQEHSLQWFVDKNPQIRTSSSAEVRRTGPSHLLGTYISFENAVILCRFFEVPSSPIEQLRTGLFAFPYLRRLL